MQYLRVLVILAVMPLVAAALPAGAGDGVIRTGPAAPVWADLALTAGCGLAGLALARLTGCRPAHCSARWRSPRCSPSPG